jgi:hypothetical protein
LQQKNLSHCNFLRTFELSSLVFFFEFYFQRIEEFKKSYEKAINDLENLHIVLLDNKSIRASEIESTIKSCSIINLDVQNFIQNVMDNGKFVKKKIIKLIYRTTFKKK